VSDQAAKLADQWAGPIHGPKLAKLFRTYADQREAHMVGDLLNLVETQRIFLDDYEVGTLDWTRQDAYVDGLEAALRLITRKDDS
jgi:hypothetical protein